MRVRRIQLKAFRTYEKLDLSFHRRLVFVTGLNALGKTNILEAISLLSMGKSFRGATDREMAADGSGGYYVSCELDRDDTTFQIEIGCDLSSGTSKKKLKLNNKVVPGRTALIGTLMSVVFSPSDIMIVEGGPVHRRKFLDSLLSREDKTYLKNLIQYNRALKQRRAIIKKIREKRESPSMLSAWTHSLSIPGQYIIQRRLKFIEDFKEIFSDSLKRISGGSDHFLPSLQLTSSLEKSDFHKAIENHVAADIRAGSTLIGPHRHDLSFQHQGKEAGRYGSQGQKRSIVLALRISEFYYLRKHSGQSPVLLIDDVIRELDGNRRSAFVELLHECGQAIFTTPDLEGMDDVLDQLKEQIQIYRIHNRGRIVEPGNEIP